MGEPVGWEVGDSELDGAAVGDCVGDEETVGRVLKVGEEVEEVGWMLTDGTWEVELGCTLRVGVVVGDALSVGDTDVVGG